MLWVLAAAVPAAAALAATPLRGEPLVDDFGRWQSAAPQCRFGQQGASGLVGCDSLRLDQQLAGLLSVRFISRDQGPRGPARLLVFAGLLEQGSPPMRCRDGRCERQGPMRMRVSVLADLGFAGPSGGLPRTRPAAGRCEILASRVTCRARGGNEASWSAETQLEGVGRL